MRIEPTERHASPQAWRRLRNTMTDGELRDIARDLADIGKQTSLARHLIGYGLIHADWEKARQI